MSSYQAQPSRRDRLKSGAMVGAVYLAGAALLWFAPRDLHPANREVEPPTVTFDVVEPAPPEPVEVSQPRAPDKSGEAGRKAEPTEVVAPPAKHPQPPPIPAAPVAGSGSSSDAGAADRGEGTGAGGSGDGRGGGGGGTAAQWLSGGLSDADYPPDALAARASGQVSVRFTVLPSGSIANCRIARSSGFRSLDDTTCRLLTQRLRFRPATDGTGRPVASEIGSDIGWGLRQRRR